MSLNRGIGRSTIFEKPADFQAFEKVLRQAQDWLPMRLLSYCLMPNHWHLVVWPRADGDFAEHFFPRSGTRSRNVDPLELETT
jgi:putative transposase